MLLLKGLNYLKYVLIVAPTLTASTLYYRQNLIILLRILFLHLGSGAAATFAA